MRNRALTPTELLDRVRRREPLVVLDVRSPAEFKEGHVPGAVNVPYTNVLAGAGDVPATKSQTLIVYCGHGPRAWMAGTALRLRGYTQVTYLRGHMATWRAAGLPEEQ